MHIWNLVTLTSFIIATTMELILFVKTSMANFIITKKTSLELKTYKKVYISSDKILKSSRTYTKSK